MEKGFSKEGARKTAKMTIARSIAARSRREPHKEKYTVKREIINGQEVEIKVYPPYRTT